MTEVCVTIDLPAPPAEVWALIMDPERLGDWVTIHRRLHDHFTGPPRVGSEMVQTLALRGAPFKVRWQLIACEAPHHAEWHGRGPARATAETEYHLSDDGSGGTRFDYRNAFSAPGGPLGALASRALVGELPRKEADASLRRLLGLLKR